MGLTNNVVDGDVILASWGNQGIRDRTMQQFASVAERDSQWPSASAPNGAHCITVDTFTVWKNVTGTGWRPMAPNISSRAIINVGTAGTWDPTKPADIHSCRLAGTTDGTGMLATAWTAAGLPRVPTAVGGIALTCLYDATYGAVQLVVNQAATNLTTLTVRAFTVTGTSATSTNIQFGMTAVYQ